MHPSSEQRSSAALDPAPQAKSRFRVHLQPYISPGEPQPECPEWQAVHQSHVRELEAARASLAAGTGQGLQLLLIGDSITEGWKGERWGEYFWPLEGIQEVWQRHFGHLRASALGLAGDEVMDLQWRLQNGGSPSGVGAQLAILLIGTNDLDESVSQSADQADSLASRIMGCAQLLLAADADLHVAVIGILPKGDVGESGPTALLPNRWSAGMTAVNERLRDFCERTPQASFHDLTSVFVEAIESQEKLRDLFLDLLHPSVTGYDAMGHALQHILKQHGLHKSQAVHS